MKKEIQKVPVWEWIVALAGLLLLAFVFVILGREAMESSDSPPAIELRLQKRVSHGTGELVLIEVHNRGGQTAADLKVRGTLGADRNAETREVTIDYVPRHSRKVVGLFFSQPVADQSLRLEPVGFVEP
jgi:uncharacterized protein (TIGR02588 family)